METDLSPEVGSAGRLFKGNVDLFWALLQRLDAVKLTKAQKTALRDEFGRLYFWGDGYYPYEGRLDEILSNSSRLRHRVMSVLVEIGEIICKDKTGLFGLVNDNLKDGKLAQQREELLQLIETIRNSLDDPASSDTCSNSTASDGEDSIEESIVSLQARNGCLRDLSVSLEHPAPDATVVEETGATTAEPFHVTGPALMWTRRILDGFPNIDVQLSGRLGHANWDRFQRISKQMESIGDLSSESENEEEEVEEEEFDYSHGPSLFSKSTGGDDSIFSRPRQSTGYGGTIATSVSERRLEYSFPAARKRPLAKDLRSQATYTSTMTDDRGERGWLRIPSLPIKEEQLGSPFRCTICGEKLHEIFNRTDWKKHVFADLEPYICTFPKCDLGLKSFANRKAWANHEFIVHRSKRTWVCSHCKRTFDDPNLFGWHLSKDHSGILPDDGIESVVKSVATTSVAVEDTACPFCRENLGNSNRTFAMHVARHMEEIALAVLPRDYDSDNEHGSVESDQSLPAMLHEDQIPDGDPEASQAIANPLRKPWNLENFDFLALLGRANYAKVALVRSKETQRLYAAKIFKKSFLLENDDMNSPLVEKQVLKLANENSHPFIARLCASTQTLTRVVFFMEYCPGGDLLVHIQRASQAFPVDTARFYAAEFCLVLKWLHEQGVIYRDVKLENIMLGVDGHIKVVDFGVCKTGIQKGEKTGSFVGSPEFLAPEMILDKPYGHEVDWWSFGVLIYQLVARKTPFRGKNEDEIYDAILMGKPVFSPLITIQTSSIISQLLEVEPTLRLGSGPGDAEDVMQHNWFEAIDWHELYRKRVPPPLFPTVSSAADTRNFDAEFTTQDVAATPDTTVLSEEAQEQFRTFDFSFENQ